MCLTVGWLPWATASAQDAIPASSGDGDAFVVSEVDNRSPFVGQQVIYTFRYYEALDSARLPSILAGQPEYRAPDFSNFWSEGDVEQVNYQDEVNGRPYNVSELRTTLFPTQPGDLFIQPSELELSDFPQTGTRILQTLPAIVGVKPLPEGAPEGFEGAVGNFILTAQVDKTATIEDEPISLRLVLSGTGNIHMAPKPIAPVLEGWRVLEQSDEVMVDNDPGSSGGRRVVDYLLVPAGGSGVTIPPMEYAFFDPAVGAYSVSTTSPIELSVAPDGSAPDAADAQVVETTPVVVAEDAPVGSQESSPVDGDDSAQEPMQLKVIPVPVRLTRAALAGNPAYWALWLSPALAIGVAAVVSLRRRGETERRRAHQQARAAGEALRALHGASQRQLSPGELCDRSIQVLNHYLSRKLGQPVAGLTRPELSAILQERGADPVTVQRINDCLRQAEFARYSPATSNSLAAQQLQAQVEVAIRELDRVL
jgi:hypothetical protein